VLNAAMNAIHAIIFAIFLVRSYDYKKGNTLAALLMAAVYCAVISFVNRYDNADINVLMNLLVLFLFSKAIIGDWRISVSSAVYLFSFGMLAEELTIYVGVLLFGSGFNEYALPQRIIANILLATFLFAYSKIGPVTQYGTLPKMYFFMSIAYAVFMVFLMQILSYVYPNPERPIASIIAVTAPALQLFAMIIGNSLLYRKFQLSEIVSNYSKVFQLKHQERLDARTFIMNEADNRIMAIGLLKQGKVEDALAQMEAEVKALDNAMEISHTGLAGVDSIINMKAQELSEEGIYIKYKYYRDFDIYVDSFNIAYILGHLIDNAAEAVRKIENHSDADREIHVGLNMSMSLLKLVVSNACYEEIKWNKNGLPASMRKKKNHKPGLYWISKIVNLHKGEMKIRHKKDCFEVDIMIRQSIDHVE